VSGFASRAISDSAHSPCGRGKFRARPALGGVFRARTCSRMHIMLKPLTAGGLAMLMACTFQPAATFSVGWRAGEWPRLPAALVGPSSCSATPQARRKKRTLLMLGPDEKDAVTELLGIVEPGLEGQYSPEQRRRIDELLETLDRVGDVCMNVCIYVQYLSCHACMHACMYVCSSRQARVAAFSTTKASTTTTGSSILVMPRGANRSGAPCATQP
jgi:hypothetical protein